MLCFSHKPGKDSINAVGAHRLHPITPEKLSYFLLAMPPFLLVGGRVGWEVGRRRKAGRERRGGGNLVKQQSLGAEGVCEEMQGRRVGLNEWESLLELAFHTKAVPFPSNSYFLKGGGAACLLEVSPVLATHE